MIPLAWKGCLAALRFATRDGKFRFVAVDEWNNAFVVAFNIFAYCSDEH